MPSLRADTLFENAPEKRSGATDAKEHKASPVCETGKILKINASVPTVDFECFSKNLLNLFNEDSASSQEVRFSGVGISRLSIFFLTATRLTFSCSYLLISSDKDSSCATEDVDWLSASEILSLNLFLEKTTPTPIPTATQAVAIIIIII